MELDSKNLCDKNGRLNFNQGMFFEDPIINANLSKRNLLRRKKWNYWTINNHKYFFTIALANFDYSGLIFAYLIDLDNNKIIEKNFLVPFGKGICLKSHVDDDIVYEGKNLNVKIINSNDKTKIELFINNFYENNCLMGYFNIYNKDVESLNIVVPWSKKKYTYACKQSALQCEGALSIGNDYIKFVKGESYGSQDFGRGVWKRNIKWNWITCSTTIMDNKYLGINLGAHWTAGSGITENGIILDGKAYKIEEDVEFQYDNDDLMKPWSIKSESNNINLIFVPIKIRESNMNFAIIKSHFKQLFGKLRGSIKINDLVITIDESLSLCEEHVAKW